ncbi:MAG: hypothetical protein JRG83_00740 [Deltaproteobacteria bacterium]|nr:hypothetical protein [Deltaproteobacteria bacterium]
MRGARLATSAALARVLMTCSALALAVMACSAEDEPGAPPPAAVHGAVVLEPGTLAVGDLVNVEITVVTPAGHRVRPVDFPESLPPLWLLDAEAFPVERDGERWTHVTRVRARVKEAPGEYEWPTQTVEVESPDGEVRPLVLEARAFTVASVADGMPERLEPYGLRAAAAEPGKGGRLVGALLGSAATLLLLGAVSVGRRVRATRGRAGGPPPDTTPSWIVADEEIARALEGLDEDPDGAADLAALALRRYVHRRANRPIETLTTEEIAAQRPPGRLRSRWPDLVALLRRLDALRFPGDLAHAEGRAALRTTLEDARRFVADSIPPRELR